jgi:hypothetical protein
MATGHSLSYNLPYPLADDSVNVHGDIKQLVEKLEAVLPLASYSQIKVYNNTSSSFVAGTPVYVTGFSTNTTIGKSLPNTSSPVLGLLKRDTPAGSTGIAIVSGILENVNTSSWSAGDILYIAEAGGLTNARPSGGSPAVGIVGYSSATEGIIIVEAKGNGTWGALKAGLA